jgi:hypothetical protein
MVVSFLDIAIAGLFPTEPIREYMAGALGEIAVARAAFDGFEEGLSEGFLSRAFLAPRKERWRIDTLKDGALGRGERCSDVVALSLFAHGKGRARMFMPTIRTDFPPGKGHPGPEVRRMGDGGV